MKKILGLILLIISINVFGQNPPGYQSRIVRERIQGSFMVDSGLHIPRYNGLPVGTRGGVSVQDGAIAMDTTNHRFYIYSGGAWIRLASYSEISGINQKFGDGDNIASAGRTFNANNTPFQINNADGFFITYNEEQSIEFSGVNTGMASFRASDVYTKLQSPNGDNKFYVFNDTTYIPLPSTSSKLIIDNIPYNSGAALVGLAIDTLTNRVYRKTASSGTPTLQQVTDVGNSTDTLIIADEFNVTRSSTSYAQLAIGSFAGHLHGSLNLRSPNGSGNISSLYPALGYTDNRTHVLPDYSGTVAIHPTISGQAGKVLAVNATEDGLEWITGGGGGVDAADLPLRITSTTVSADTSIALVPSLTTNARLQKIIDSLQAKGWGDNLYSEPWYSAIDELRQTDRGQHYYGSGGTGSATTIISNISTATFPGWIGRADFITGTTTTGFANLYFGAGGQAPVVLDNSFRTNVGVKLRLEDLSDGTDTYGVLSGLMDIGAELESSIVDGVWFSYTNADSSGKFVCKTRSNSSTTAVASSITVAADTDYKLEISVYNGHALFYIDKVLVADITTTIPTGTSRITGINHRILKSAGTTSRTMYIDWGAYGTRSN